MKRLRVFAIVPAAALALWICMPVEAQVTQIEKHVRTLASEAMEGRLTGTQGARRAADYIIEQLKRLGASPLPGEDDFRLPFDFTSGVSDVGSKVQVADWVAPSSGLRGLSFSDTGSVDAAVVFAGYGITVPDSQDFGYDSYHGLDVEGKIVLVLRYFPEDAAPEIKSILARYSGLRYKALNARERGAIGLLVVTGPNSPNAGELAPITLDGATAGSGIVAASISGEVAQELFEHAPGKSLVEIQSGLDSANPHVTGFEIPDLVVRLEVRLEREKGRGYNVAGVLPASGGSGQDRPAVVLGAHYDHLGWGRQGNSLAGKEESGQVHAGADDNASGVAAVLAVAELLANQVRSAPLILTFWSGEEIGLLGSGEFVKTAILTPEQITAYLNFDMVGRMRQNKLVLQAAGTSSVWPRLIEQTNVPIGFSIQVNEDPYLPTDATSFNQAGVPSLNFFTGSHKEYHRPADRPELLNYEDLDRVARFGALLSEKLSKLESKPDFIKVARKRQEGGSRDTVRAFTGTIPDYSAEVEGLLLSGVVEGGPAEQAGLRAGDVVVEFAGQKITNIYDYTYALDVVKIGETIPIVYLRDGERRETALTPTARK